MRATDAVITIFQAAADGILMTVCFGLKASPDLPNDFRTILKRPANYRGKVSTI